MKHYLLNITWRCQNRCSYCWVNQTIRQRPELCGVEEQPLMRWVEAICRDTPDVIDIAGGEPFLVWWLPELIQAFPNVNFGLSTNGLASEAVLNLALKRMPNVIAINVSYHPETKAPAYDRSFRLLVGALHRMGAPVHCNLVDAPGNRERAVGMWRWMDEAGIRHEVSPYEEMRYLGDKLAKGLCCQGGVNHLTVDPWGNAWPCLTSLRSPYWREYRLGNWIDGTVDLSRKIQPCHLNCVDYYVLPQEHVAGDMWQIKARPCES